ncbi:hypothetical protein TNIN_388671 [Trichonephila inaurata madagascariensis]|uniref:Uncharacterized protein n=1 Tax=Trichonephila inaurata madagascariensis TaxID=2747483 RepID=A0A8X6I8S3_9ARAC|nr:hypothetical protein TNIN_388671 [Trichonephila inaurata madagascariensis]
MIGALREQNVLLLELLPEAGHTLTEAASDRKKAWLACYFCNLEYRERNGFGVRVPKGCKRALYDTLLVGGSTRLAVGLNEWPLPTDHSLSDNVHAPSV